MWEGGECYLGLGGGHGSGSGSDSGGVRQWVICDSVMDGLLEGSINWPVAAISRSARKEGV